MAVGFGFSKSKSKQKSKQESGVNRFARGVSSNQLLFDQNTTGGLGKPGGPDLRGGTSALGQVRDLINTEFFDANAPQIAVDRSTGLPASVARIFEGILPTLTQSAFSQASANRANAGQRSAQNLTAIVGDTTRRIGASLFPQFSQQALQADLFNTTARQNQVAQGLDLLQTSFLQNLLGLATGGSSGVASGRSSGFGFNTSIGGGGGGKGTSPTQLIFG
jgi:hypothetical protein